MKSDESNQLTSADVTPGSPRSPPQLLFDMLIGTQTSNRMLMTCKTRVTTAQQQLCSPTNTLIC